MDAAPLALPRRVCAGYFGLQAVAGVVFWSLVAWVEPVRDLLTMSEAEHAVTDSYLFADVVLGIVGSAAAGLGLWTGRRWAPMLAVFVAGGMVYATLYLVGWVGFTGEGAALLGVMLVPSTLSTWFAYQATRLPPLATGPVSPSSGGRGAAPSSS